MVYEQRAKHHVHFSFKVDLHIANLFSRLRDLHEVRYRVRIKAKGVG